MSYRSGYRRRSVAPAKKGRVARPNKYAGPCHYCGQEVPAGKGQLWSGDAGWESVHLEMHWAGSPVSGRYVGGCPGEAAKLNAGPTAEERDASRALSDAALTAVTALARGEAPRDSRGGYLDECGSCGMASCAC